MGLGFSFGSKKTKSTQDTTANKTETGTQSGTSTTNQATSQSSTTNQAGTSSSQTYSDGKSQSNSLTSGASTAQQQQTTQNFSDATLGGLENLVSQLLGSGKIGTVESISDFDPAAFVANGMRAATARARTGLDESIGGILDAVGGRNNSAAALLQERVNNDANSMLAGVESQLTGQAEEIRRNNLLAGNTMASSQSDLLSNLLGALRGGITTTTGATTEQTSQQQQNQSTTSETGGQNQQTTQTSTTQAMETMVSQLAQLLNSLTSSTGTESIKGTGKQTGFGMGLSL
jgi:hypothetical protein